MTASRRVAPDPMRDDLRLIRIRRRRARLMAALAEIEVLHGPAVLHLYAFPYWIDLITTEVDGSLEDPDKHDAANEWLYAELLEIDPEVLARHLMMDVEAASSQKWRATMVAALYELAKLDGFDKVRAQFSGPMGGAVRQLRFDHLGDRKLKILLRLVSEQMPVIPGPLSARIKKLLH